MNLNKIIILQLIDFKLIDFYIRKSQKCSLFGSFGHKKNWGAGQSHAIINE